MSYLDVPRLHFAGRFRVDTSTVNNIVSHFDTATFRLQDALPPPAGKGGLNPWGTHAWEIKDCVIQSVRYRDGSVCASPIDDPIIGAPVQDAYSRVSAKMVDLDPEQQSVSEIWGLQIRVGAAISCGTFRGDFEVASFTDIWTRVQNGYFDSDSSAFYQSVVSSLIWSEFLPSRLLQELRQVSPDRVSIKFILDGFNDVPASPNFMFGRIVGTIGPAWTDEPARIVVGRILKPVSRSSPLNYAYCLVDTVRQKVILDMGNSIPTITSGGPPPSKDQLGNLRLAILHPLAPHHPLRGAETLGSIDYEEIPHLSHHPYLQTAGIQEFSVTSEQLSTLESTQLGVVHGNTLAVLLAEDPEGSFVRADQCVFRLNPGDTAEVSLVATTFGKPAVNQKIVLGYMTGGLQPADGVAVGTPQEALTFPPFVVTDEQGQASFLLSAQDPKNPRVFIDGQVYGVSYSWGEEKPPTPKNLISVLVWNETICTGVPTWYDNVYPILKHYANLYPVMERIVDLGSYDSVVQHIDRIRAALTLPVSDPNYMPVTRDLSRSKHKLLIDWCNDPIAMKEIATVEELRRALQQAIQLEYAKIPPYLYALYSIKLGTNVAVTRIVERIVLEEMLHVARLCNLLNAVGGHPLINQPSFTPQYPTSFPMGLRSKLTFGLERCSLDLIRGVFMPIEEPEDLRCPPSKYTYTIGAFYKRIEQAIERLGECIFTGDPALQVTARLRPGKLFPITEAESARKAIPLIADQGKGDSPLNPETLTGEKVGQRKMAHYYQLDEIVKGRRLVIKPDGYDFSGTPVPFDENGLWPLVANPKVEDLPDGSRAKVLCEQFNQMYRKFLVALHQVFNGNPSQLDSAIGIMFSLKLQAMVLVQTPIGGGLNAGPTFEFMHAASHHTTADVKREVKWRLQRQIHHLGEPHTY